VRTAQKHQGFTYT